MSKGQIELLLNQLYSCSLSIYDAIDKDDLSEISHLIKQKNKLIQLIEANKKFLPEKFSIFDAMIEKIKEQEDTNLKFMKERKNVFFIKYQNTAKTVKILNKYTPSEPRSGAIIDTSE